MLVAVVGLAATSASAQSVVGYTWGGAGSTTSTSNYNLATNWSTPPVGAPPIAAGQGVYFEGTGSSAVNVSAGSIAPNFFNFGAGAQSYTLAGGDINFSSAAAVFGGIFDNATSGQTISIANNIGESVAGVQVQLQGSSTLILSGANTYSGGTYVKLGTLQVTNNHAVGIGTVNLEEAQFQANGVGDLTFANNFKINNSASGSAIDANGVVLTIAGNISDGAGAGKLTVLDSAGGGVLVLTGNNTYSGGTTICFCATLQLGDATHTASMAGDIVNEGRFNIVNADTTAITSITTDGGLTTFKNKTSAAGIAITNRNGGGTEFFDSSRAGNATIVNRTGGVTIFNNTSAAANANITNRSTGTTVFTDKSSAGNATITTLNGGQTLFFAAATGGNAQFIANGSGIVDFSGSTGPNGDGRISAGSIAGSGTYVIGAGNTLVVGSNNLSTEVSGVIADSCGCAPGAGSLEKVGSGTLVLSGANVYTGTTTVNGGVLQVDGSIASSSLTTVTAGGALTGIGAVGNTTIANGGIFLPGNGAPGSSVSVQGSLALQSGALYVVTLNSTSSSFAAVTGNAALNGTVVASFAPGSTVLQQYTIMQAGSTTGNFAGVAAPGGLVGTTVPGAGVVYLNFALDYGAKNSLNINQGNVASTLQNFFKSGGRLPASFAGLGPGGLTQASGEPGAGPQQTTFNAMNLFIGLLTDVFNTGRSGVSGATPYADETNATAYAATGKRPSDALAAIYRKASAPTFELRWDVWAAGFGGSQTTDGNAALGSNSTSSNVYGTAVGVDYRFAPSTIAGFALAGGGTGFNVNGLGWGRSDLFQAGAFLRHNSGPAYITAALAYGWQDVTTNRIVTAAGVDQLRAQFNANTLSGRIEGGYRQATQWIGLTPYAALQATMFSLPNFSEFAVVGNNTFALNYAAKDVTSTRTELGLRADKSFAAAGGLMSLRGRLAWAHDYNPDRAVGAVFQTLPGTAFVVNGATQARDSALTTASVQVNWMNGWSAAATFEGEFSNVTRSYAGKGVVRYTW